MWNTSSDTPENIMYAFIACNLTHRKKTLLVFLVRFGHFLSTLHNALPNTV